jgi:hypothetical protein
MSRDESLSDLEACLRARRVPFDAGVLRAFVEVAWPLIADARDVVRLAGEFLVAAGAVWAGHPDLRGCGRGPLLVRIVLARGLNAGMLSGWFLGRRRMRSTTNSPVWMRNLAI